MPTYEYRCEQCRRRNAFSVRGFNPPEAPTCAYCGSNSMKRIISRVAILKSEDARLEAMADPSTFGDIDENDPKGMARMMRKMGNEMGEDLPPEFDDVVDRLEKGQKPEDIEKELPDLGAGDASGGEPDF